jgi:LPS sulfotransferase NodH
MGIWSFRRPKKREALGLRGYAICTSPRTGSNWLCYLLSSTGQLGHPREYFNCEARRQLDDPDYPAEPAEQFGRILTVGATPNGVYALKVFPEQHDAIAPACAWTKLLPNLKFVWLQRRDILGQALSAARVIQTGQYRSTVSATAQPNYDANLIRGRLIAAVKDQARWSLFFARTGIVPLPVDYEDILANPQRIIDRIADFVRSSQRAIIRPELIELRKQRDAVTEEWRTRFLREEGGSDVIDPL